MTLLDGYWPFEEGPGADSGVDRWRKMARAWSPDGVVPGFGEELDCNVEMGQRRVTIAPGACWVDGFYGESTSSKVINFGAGNGYVVASVDPLESEIRFRWRDNDVVDDADNVSDLPLVHVHPNYAPGYFVLRPPVGPFRLHWVQTELTITNTSGVAAPPDSPYHWREANRMTMRFRRDCVVNLDYHVSLPNNGDTVIFDNAILTTPGRSFISRAFQDWGANWQIVFSWVGIKRRGEILSCWYFSPGGSNHTFHVSANFWPLPRFFGDVRAAAQRLDDPFPSRYLPYIPPPISDEEGGGPIVYPDYPGRREAEGDHSQ